MSYILDALKKIEREKARKDRHSGMTNLSGELFSDDSSTNSRGSNVTRISAIIILVAMVTFGVTWYLLRGGDERKMPPQQTSTLPTAPSSTPVPAPVAPSVAPPFPPQVSSPVPSPALPTALPSVTVKPVQNQPAAVTEDPEEGENRGRRRSRIIRPQETAPAASQIQQPGIDSQVTPAPVDIKVSGIAWQEERRARRAVVNGYLLHEGSVIAGAKVTEILQDRVRFSQSGGKFEVSLVSAGMPVSK